MALYWNFLPDAECDTAVACRPDCVNLTGTPPFSRQPGPETIGTNDHGADRAHADRNSTHAKIPSVVLGRPHEVFSFLGQYCSVFIRFRSQRAFSILIYTKHFPYFSVVFIYGTLLVLEKDAMGAVDGGSHIRTLTPPPPTHLVTSSRALQLQGQVVLLHRPSCYRRQRRALSVVLFRRGTGLGL